MNYGKKRSTTAAVQARYGNIHRRTLGRWITDPDMGFPTPIEINGRLYFDDEELDAFDHRQVLATLGKKAA